MGFIPIILTLSAAIILFVLAVHNALKSKKSQAIKAQEAFITGLTNLNYQPTFKLGLESSNLSEMEKAYRSVKSELKAKKNEPFEIQVRNPYQAFRMTVLQYNKLIKKKPYSFVAGITGHQPIG